MTEAQLQELWEQCAEPLQHPNREMLQAAGEKVLDWVLEDFSSLPTKTVGKSATRLEMENRLRQPPPEEGIPFDQVLREFQDKVAPFAFRPNHPRFLAFIPGAPTMVSVLGDWLCAGANYFAGVWLEAAGPAQVEIVVLDWFKEFLGYPREAGGLLTGGGSEATLTALTVARERLPYPDREKAVLYTSDQRHWSVDRAAKIIGLRQEQIQVLPADSEYRLPAATLAGAVARDREKGLVPWAVVAHSGATNTGAIDPLADLALVSSQQSLWLHVDAAFGWSAALTAEGRKLLAGIDRADSITLDPHKWFGQTFEAGCVLVREGRLLPETFSLRPEYMQDVEPAQDEINFCDHGLALTRRFRALKIWLSIKVLGVGWFRRLVERCCALAELARALLEKAGGFEILSPPRLSILCFRFLGRVESANPKRELDRLNQALYEGLRADGRAFLSTTRLEGKLSLRMCFVNWRTTGEDVKLIVDLLKKMGERMESGRFSLDSGNL